MSTGTDFTSSEAQLRACLPVPDWNVDLTDESAVAWAMEQLRTKSLNASSGGNGSRYAQADSLQHDKEATRGAWAYCRMAQIGSFAAGSAFLCAAIVPGLLLLFGGDAATVLWESMYVSLGAGLELLLVGAFIGYEKRRSEKHAR